ncbi:MAG TPA: flagella basal body P-ring formation protein FlgA [Fimbriimonadaceae bacterium]|nr:flagella basal body P-ring formation protein FlgA [Fimbriimonadaceae bacterium]
MIAVLISSLAMAANLSLPVHVDGEGYLRFVRDGRIVYSASADFSVDSGQLVYKGLPLTPSVRIPASASRLEVDLSGNIVAVLPKGRTTCGRIVLARFETKPTEDHGFLVSLTRATIGNPGEGLFGVIRSANAASSAAPHIAPAIPSGSPTVSVRKLTEIESKNVTLGDIATISGDQADAVSAIEYCAAPPVGIDVPITATRVKALLKRAGIEADVDVPVGAILRQKFQPVTQDQFVAAAVKAAQESLGAEVPLTCLQDGEDFRAPSGQLELKSEGISASGASLTVTVGVYVGGKRVNSRSILLKADATAQVKAGTAVKIYMKSGGVTVEVPGVTRTAGMIGQTVTVMVTQTGSILSGVVIGVDKVEVKV